MHLLIAKQHSRHRTNAHSCLVKLAAALKLSPDMIANRIQLAGCTYLQTQTMGWTLDSQWATATAPFSIAMRQCQKKLFCANSGSRTMFCTQVMTPSIAWRLTATRPKLVLNGAPRLLAPPTTSAVNSKTWTTQGNYEVKLMPTKSKLDSTYLVQMATSPKLWGQGGQDVPYIRATPHGGAIKLPLVPHKRLIVSLAGLHSWVTDPTQLHEAIYELAEHVKMVIVIDPTTILGQKQLSPCPTSDRAATVDSTVLFSSSKNFGASFRNPVRR